MQRSSAKKLLALHLLRMTTPFLQERRVFSTTARKIDSSLSPNNYAHHLYCLQKEVADVQAILTLQVLQGWMAPLLLFLLAFLVSCH